MYILAPNQVAKTYPYSIGELRRDNPATSFPKKPSDAMLASWGVYPVFNVGSPAFNHATQNLSEGDPVLVGGQWQQTWVVTDATSEEVTQRATQHADDMRNKRNQLLSNSDWTQVADAPVNAAAWAAYRQALRDITAHANFPYLLDTDWPAKPD
jgi:hypothetical protein